MIEPSFQSKVLVLDEGESQFFPIIHIRLTLYVQPPLPLI